MFFSKPSSKRQQLAHGEHRTAASMKPKGDGGVAVVGVAPSNKKACPIKKRKFGVTGLLRKVSGSGGSFHKSKSSQPPKLEIIQPSLTWTLSQDEEEEDDGLFKDDEHSHIHKKARKAINVPGIFRGSSLTKNNRNVGDMLKIESQASDEDDLSTQGNDDDDVLSLPLPATQSLFYNSSSFSSNSNNNNSSNQSDPSACAVPDSLLRLCNSNNIQNSSNSKKKNEHQRMSLESIKEETEKEIDEDDDNLSMQVVTGTDSEQSDFQQREICHMRHELAKREQVICKLVEINKVLIEKHHREIKSLSLIFTHRLEQKEQQLLQHNSLLNNAGGIPQEIVLLKDESQRSHDGNTEEEKQQRDTMLLRHQLHEAKSKIDECTDKHTKELRVYDNILAGLQEDLMQVQSELDVTSFNLEKTSQILKAKQQILEEPIINFPAVETISNQVSAIVSKGQSMLQQQPQRQQQQHQKEVSRQPKLIIQGAIHNKVVSCKKRLREWTTAETTITEEEKESEIEMS